VRLLEATSRLGGTIATERVDGFLIEAGPDSFLSEKPWALALIKRLGIIDRVVGTDERFRRTFIVHRGALHPIPEGFHLLAPAKLWPLLTSRLFSTPGKLRMAMDLILPKGSPRADESLASLVTRRLGREALERVAQPVVAGIYAADPDQLSVAATMPRFLAMEQKERSLILALWRAARRQPEKTSTPRWSLFLTFINGMEELVHALTERLPSGSAQFNRDVIALERQAERWDIRMADGSSLTADGVVLAAHAPQSAKIISRLDPELADLLDGIPHSSSVTISLGYRRADVPHPLDGFGFVVPRIENRSILACTFSSVKYPARAPDGYVLLRAFLGGALHESVLEQDESSLLNTARVELASLLGVTAEPVLSRVHRHPVALPQYRVGHLERIAAIEERLRKQGALALAGSSYRGVGIADCIRSGEEAADALIQISFE
jgi:oxygen-dependent protoporphyrinogen oxidase